MAGVYISKSYISPAPPREGTATHVHRAFARIADAPAELSDWDLRLIAAYNQDAARRAFVARAAARDEELLPPRPRRVYATGEELATISHSLGSMIGRSADELKAENEELRRQVEHLRRDLYTLKATQPEYTGVWDPTRLYRKGHMVTSGGSTWHCNESCENIRPGGSDHWQLMVKRGKDAAREGR
jgi:hypothetical protein